MSEYEKSEVNPGDLRRAFGTFVTGITVVTTLDTDRSPRGMTANSFTSVSLDPPLLLVCIGKSASSFPAFSAADSFAVNVLHEGQRSVASAFASKSATKFEGVSHHTVHTGAPVLADCLTWFDCTTYDRRDAGDHMILVGHVRAFGTSPASPLGFCRGDYVSVEDPMPSNWAPSHRMRISYLVEHEGRILLCDDGSGGWGLPTAKNGGGANVLSVDNDDAVELLSEDTFLYSVFDVADNAPGYVVYRGVLSRQLGSVPRLPPSMKFFAPNELPWDRISLRQLRAMLCRYLRERSSARFGVYVDSSDGGRVAMIDPPRRWTEASGEAS